MFIKEIGTILFLYAFCMVLFGSKRSNERKGDIKFTEAKASLGNRQDSNYKLNYANTYYSKAILEEKKKQTKILEEISSKLNSK